MSSVNPTSLSLLQRIRGGDDTGWRRLVELYGPLVNHWCRRWGVQGADADDVAQEVFQAAVQKISSFRRDRPNDTFRGWLRGITRFKVLDYWRARGQNPGAAGGSEALQRLQEVPERETAEDPEDAGEVSAVFHRALEMLRSEFEDRTWQAFWLVTVDGQKATEAAALLGMTASAVRMCKSRVLRRLREQLGDVVEEG
jgi:RNA polymerase sigma-70 factor (ECF subfamily)